MAKEINLELKYNPFFALNVDRKASFVTSILVKNLGENSVSLTEIKLKNHKNVPVIFNRENIFEGDEENIQLNFEIPFSGKIQTDSLILIVYEGKKSKEYYIPIELHPKEKAVPKEVKYGFASFKNNYFEIKRPMVGYIYKADFELINTGEAPIKITKAIAVDDNFKIEVTSNEIGVGAKSIVSAWVNCTELSFKKFLLVEIEGLPPSETKVLKLMIKGVRY